jgi:hypothetical protein
MLLEKQTQTRPRSKQNGIQSKASLRHLRENAAQAH